MDPYQTILTTHPALSQLRLVNRRTLEHVGVCPFCGGDQRSDRFHVWMEAGRERYWCRACDAKGPLGKLVGEEIRPRAAERHHQQARPAAQANPAHIARYREIYAVIALWAHSLLLDPANPEPLTYLRGRGFSEDAVAHALLGVTLRDPQAIPGLLRRECPELLPDAEAAGVLARDYAGDLRAHPNLCGALLFPYLAEGQVVDLRTRSFPGKGYRSLPGGYADRGAVALFGWDSLDGNDSALITEGELKALAVTQGYRAGRLSAPALAHPGLSYLRPEWVAQLRSRGVRTVTLAYDSGPRPIKDGTLQLAPEEAYSVRHGLVLAAAGLEVRVLRLPLAPSEDKADLDAFLLRRGPAVLERLISAAPTLADYHASLPANLLKAANLPPAAAYPRHRARPSRLSAPATTPAKPIPDSASAVAAARAAIPDMVCEHAIAGEGMLVLAHPPGTGKGHGATAGLRTFLQTDPAPQMLVWTGARKDQAGDQQGLTLIPLHGRNTNNCHRLGEAQALSTKGYQVREALCMRRCLHLNSCGYLRQFNEEGDRFAPQALLLATNWWQEAGVVVLDEFDPGQIARIVTLTSRDLAAMSQGASPPAQDILRWLGAALAASGGLALRGATLLRALDDSAAAEGCEFPAALAAAVNALPPAEDRTLLRGLPAGATLADFQALPPGHLPTILTQLAHEDRLRLCGRVFTSRLEIRNGELMMMMRHDHLHAQLANPTQPKLILDATVSEALLRALFPSTPITLARPHIPIPSHVTQVLGTDWAKSTVRNSRRTRWYDAVAAQIRPGRPTLVVCTLECEADLRAALGKRGHPTVTVAHYGALRGSNAYKGYDIILAQVYHPNLEAIVHEGRALFGGDATPLDERVVIEKRTLTDAQNASWAVQVPTFADPRLAALLDRRREAEMTQCALRGRPFDHPESQITLMFSLPLPALPPTTIIEPTPTPRSNGGRQAAAVLKLIAAAQTLMAAGQTRLAATELALAAQVSEVTARDHWSEIAARLGLREEEEQISARGRSRTYRRRVLVQPGETEHSSATCTDQADNKDSVMCLIRTDPPPQMSCTAAGDPCGTPVIVDPSDAPLAHEIPAVPTRSPEAADRVSRPIRRPRTRFIHPKVWAVGAELAPRSVRVSNQQSRR